MMPVRSSAFNLSEAVSSRRESIPGEGLHCSSKRPAQAGSIISMAPVEEEDESNCSCLTVMKERVSALWTACYETVSPSITSFYNWVSNLFTGANPAAGQEAVAGIDDESALQRVYSAISIQIGNLLEFVRSNCVRATEETVTETLEPVPQQDATGAESGVVNPTRDTAAHVVVENIEVRIEGAEEPPALALLERPTEVDVHAEVGGEG